MKRLDAVVIVNLGVDATNMRYDQIHTNFTSNT